MDLPPKPVRSPGESDESYNSRINEWMAECERIIGQGKGPGGYPPPPPPPPPLPSWLSVVIWGVLFWAYMNQQPSRYSGTLDFGAVLAALALTVPGTRRYILGGIILFVGLIVLMSVLAQPVLVSRHH